MNRYYDENDYCRKCWFGLLNRTTERRNSNSDGLKRFHSSEGGIKYREKMSKIHKGKISGDKNPMKRPDVAKKVSEARKEMFKDPDIRKIYSEANKKAWADGKFEGVRVGQCKWFDYKHSNGDVYKVQGTWELAFIKWLDKNNMKFTCHRGRIPYILKEEDHSYYPDFWVDEWDSYVDVKCRYFYNEEKFNAIRESNPVMNLKILYKKDLQELGVDIK